MGMRGRGHTIMLGRVRESEFSEVAGKRGERGLHHTVRGGRKNTFGARFQRITRHNRNLIIDDKVI